MEKINLGTKFKLFMNQEHLMGYISQQNLPQPFYYCVKNNTYGLEPFCVNKTFQWHFFQVTYFEGHFKE